MKILNYGTSKLDHIVTLGKPNKDKKGLGYKCEKSESKTMFVKGSTSAVVEHQILML